MRSLLTYRECEADARRVEFWVTCLDGELGGLCCLSAWEIKAVFCFSVVIVKMLPLYVFHAALKIAIVAHIIVQCTSL